PGSEWLSVISAGSASRSWVRSQRDSRKLIELLTQGAQCDVQCFHVGLERRVQRAGALQIAGPADSLELADRFERAGLHEQPQGSLKRMGGRRQRLGAARVEGAT